MSENLVKAKRTKNNEFYTRLEDIEKELIKYKEYFKDKVIYLPCDSPTSNFVKYFKSNFKPFGIRKLIATSYCAQGHGTLLKLTPNEQISELKGNGDFRSEEVKQYWEEADIIITNPPYSLFREFFKYIKNKKFLVIGSIIINSYISIVPYFKDNKIWFSADITKFITEDNNIKSISSAWWTNIGEYPDREFIKLTKSIKDTKYDTYDDFPNIINVNCYKDIPKDYFGLMGVPPTIVRKYNPKQFEIIDYFGDGFKTKTNGKCNFARYIIRRKHDE